VTAERFTPERTGGRDAEGRPVAVVDALRYQRARDMRDAECRRIARALHDETLQELGVALARVAAGPDDELVGILRSVRRQVRAAIDDLRLGEERDGPFPRRVEDVVEVHRAMAPSCDVDVAVSGVPETLPGDTAAHVLGVIGEALTNARRHAAARRVEVRVGMAGDALVAEVADDGRGLDPDRAPDATGGHGIAGMRERAALLGGALYVAPRTGGGTTVELRVPLFELRAAGERVRVLLVDDHAAIREAMALAFAEDDGFVVAGQAGTLAEARTMLDGVDVAIVDLRLPDGSGADLIGELRANGSDARALVLSADVDRVATARAVEKGAAAVLDKSMHLHDVVAAVRRLRAGETLIPLEEVVELMRLAARERDREAEERRLAGSLTPREREILQLLAEGLDSRRSAARLHISPRTHRNHVANVLAKLGVHSQLQAVVFASRCGIVDVSSGIAADVRAPAPG
jgi:DNA-binding NarL/FixJ family response regulator